VNLVDAEGLPTIKPTRFDYPESFAFQTIPSWPAGPRTQPIARGAQAGDEACARPKRRRMKADFGMLGKNVQRRLPGDDGFINKPVDGQAAHSWCRLLKMQPGRSATLSG